MGAGRLAGSARSPAFVLADGRRRDRRRLHHSGRAGNPPDLHGLPSGVRARPLRRSQRGVSPDPTLHAALSVQRAIGRSLYRDDERDLIAKLGRHVERALRLGIELYEAKTTAESLGSALRKAGIAVFTLDRSDLILFKNEEAERVLDGPLRIVDGRLLVRSDGRDLTMTEAFALQGRGSGSGAQAVAPFGAAEALWRSADPLRTPAVDPGRARRRPSCDNRGRSSWSSNKVRPRRPTGAVLRDPFGLTSAEARLAACISGGASPREAARTLGITEETARSVLKRIFHKTGTNRQSQLAGPPERDRAPDPDARTPRVCLADGFFQPVTQNGGCASGRRSEQ